MINLQIQKITNMFEKASAKLKKGLDKHKDYKIDDEIIIFFKELGDAI